MKMQPYRAPKTAFLFRRSPPTSYGVFVLILLGLIGFTSIAFIDIGIIGRRAGLFGRISIHEVQVRVREGVRISGNSKLLTPPNPFYLHYVRFKRINATNHQLRFTEYLSVMSAVQYLKPDGILLHGDVEPEGPYWDKLKSDGHIRHIFRNKTTNVGYRRGKPKLILSTEHSADMAKLDALIEYGGVAVDFDVFFVHGERIKQILTHRKALLCYGDKDGYNIGFVAAHQSSKMLHAWRRSYQDIYVPQWNFNQAFVAKYLAALFHEEVYVADKICNNPHPDGHLHEFFHHYGTVEWRNSMAIHSYERHGGVPIKSAQDLGGNLTSHKELLATVFLNLPLPPVDPGFRDEINPFTSELL